MFLRVFKNVLFNIFTFVANLFVWRDKKIWVIGGWMGQKYTDNSRYLFDFLTQHGEVYKIKKVFWVTRNPKVVSEMNALGFSNVLLVGTKKCFFYHLKSGVHVICNSIGTKYPGDIDTRFSFGAKKIQLWHGVGIKACNKLCRREKHTVKYWIVDNVFCHFEKPGHWNSCFFLTTSPENSRVAREDFGVRPTKIIEAQYPRNVWSPILKPEEKRLIDCLKTKRLNKQKVILFLPTFKEKGTCFKNPDELTGFTSFLKKNSIIWIQKKHFADLTLDFKEAGNRVINLESDFDINVLYDYVDLLITDYSSASTDAMSHNKMTLEYCPDFYDYLTKDRGFVNDFSLYHAGQLVEKPETLFSAVLKSLDVDAVDFEKYNNTKVFLLGEKNWSMDEIVKKILAIAKINIQRRAV